MRFHFFSRNQNVHIIYSTSRNKCHLKYHSMEFISHFILIPLSHLARFVLVNFYDSSHESESNITSSSYATGLWKTEKHESSSADATKGDRNMHLDSVYMCVSPSPIVLFSVPHTRMFRSRSGTALNV